jgi:glycosyltransferase involved in cell wall biosynthesis
VVLLAGRPRDRIVTVLLPRLVRWLGLQHQVLLCDSLDDPTPLYHAADALVLPSLGEGMPNTVLEAHLAGLPVVVSRQANRDKLVADGDTGLEVPTGSFGPLARAMGDIVAMTPEARRAMGQRGRQRIIDRFAGTRRA